MVVFRTKAEALRSLIDERRKPDPDTRPDDRYRLASADQIEVNSDMYQRMGYKIRPWLPTSPGSPCVKRDRYGGYSYKEFDRDLTEGWFDHPYRLIIPEGKPMFCSEPYAITAKGLRNLARLADEGWYVTVRGRPALHFPGDTMVVAIQKGRVDDE